MAYSTTSKRRIRQTRSKARNKQSLHKPKGAIGARVTKVGGDRFAIVCVDPAKQRSEWMMADYFGNVLIPPQTLEHQATFFKLAVIQIREAQERHDIQDTIVVVERTGNFYLAPKRAFAKAGLEVRIVHPFATKQYRMPADPGNKTDENDLTAMHRAATAGFGLCERTLESPYRELQLLVRHRRNLVEKASSLTCQVRDHLHLAMPGYAALFDHLPDHRSAMAIARCCDSPTKVMKLGHDGIRKLLREHTIRYQPRTIDKVLAWASQAPNDDIIEDGPSHYAIWTDLHELYQHYKKQILSVERDLAGHLVKTPYVRLLAIAGIGVVSAAELAGELGPIHHYANAKTITGRAGLYPSRYQSNQTDQKGSIVRQSNRRVRCVLMRIADNLAFHCAYYRGRADLELARGVDKRASRVKIASKFTRLAFACVAGDQAMKHPAFQQSDSILEKLREFHHVHKTPMDQLLEDLNQTVSQLPDATRSREAGIVAEVLKHNSKRKRGGIEIGALLPAVLTRLGMNQNGEIQGVKTPNESDKTEIRDRS